MLKKVSLRSKSSLKKAKRNIGIHVSETEFSADDQKSETQKKVDSYWKKRMQEAKVWNLIWTSSNAIFSIAAIVKPMTPEHRYVNMVYLFFSVV